MSNSGLLDRFWLCAIGYGTGRRATNRLRKFQPIAGQSKPRLPVPRSTGCLGRFRHSSASSRNLFASLLLDMPSNLHEIEPETPCQKGLGTGRSTQQDAARPLSARRIDDPSRPLRSGGAARSELAPAAGPAQWACSTGRPRQPASRSRVSALAGRSRHLNGEGFPPGGAQDLAMSSSILARVPYSV